MAKISPIYHCKYCGETKPASSFYRGNKSKCRECLKLDYLERKKLPAKPRNKKLPKPKPAQTAEQSSKRIEQSGWVYFIQSVDGTGLIKIGHTTTSITRRLSSIQGQCPVILKVIGSFQGTLLDERATQQRLDFCRNHHEWFYPDPELLEFIAELTKLKKAA